ncbi:hypothetical protein [Hwanghaeella sp. LZ110]|uniref:hypothetical protein n=1 Tax=Hwanghaeella sp. LZ110 TaxID=3402810 RepID=UPI003B673428
MAIGTITPTEKDGVFRFRITTFHLNLSGILKVNPAYVDDGRMKMSHIGQARGSHGEIVDVLGAARYRIEKSDAEFRGENLFNLWFTDPDFPTWRMAAYPRRDDAGAIYWDIQRSQEKQADGQADAAS